MAEKEYINRNELIDDFQNDLVNLYLDGLKGTPRPREIKITNVIERIEDFPTADVAPVKHGHWDVGYFHDRVCSCCLHPSNDLDDYPYNFCPHCGAKMTND